jgi:hypothetical protein
LVVRLGGSEVKIERMRFLSCSIGVKHTEGRQVEGRRVLRAWSAALLAAACALEAVAAAAADPDVRRDPTVLAVEQVMPAVVNIATETIVHARDPFDNCGETAIGQLQCMAARHGVVNSALVTQEKACKKRATWPRRLGEPSVRKQIQF